MTEGIINIWQDLSALDPQDVCRRALVNFDTIKGAYLVPCFGEEIFLSPKKQCITEGGEFGRDILPRIQFYTLVAFPFYLVHAQEQPLARQFVNPRALKGGDFFARGTHALPLARIAAKYNSEIELFNIKGKSLGGEIQEFGDAAWVVHPLPRVSVLMILWRGDEEFSPRAELLFDQTPTTYLPIDILWAIAMMCASAIL